MTQDSAPAGWYDDPAGGGGRRYWNGRAWTERTQGGATARTPRATRVSSSRDRLPDGYMMLNGERVPLGTTTVPAAPQSQRGLVVAVLVVIGVMVLFALGSALASSDGWTSSDGEPLFEFGEGTSQMEASVTSANDSPVDVAVVDGDSSPFRETGASTPWETSLDADWDDTVLMVVLPTDDEDVVTCRITDPDGDVLVQQTSYAPGRPVTCRYAGDE